MRSEPPTKNIRPDSYPGRLYLLFALLALFSTLGLDSRGARRGEKAYVFSTRTIEKEVPVTPVPLADSVRRFLQSSGIPPESVEELEDADGTLRMVAQLPASDYESLEPRLDKVLLKKEAAVDKKRSVEEGLTSYSWRITGRQEEGFSLVFALLEPPAEEKEKEAVPPSPPEPRGGQQLDRRPHQVRHERGGSPLPGGGVALPSPLYQGRQQPHGLEDHPGGTNHAPDSGPSKKPETLLPRQPDNSRVRRFRPGPGNGAPHGLSERFPRFFRRRGLLQEKDHRPLSVLSKDGKGHRHRTSLSGDAPSPAGKYPSPEKIQGEA